MLLIVLSYNKVLLKSLITVIMTQKQLLRKDILKVSKEECLKYKLSSNYTTILLQGSRNLVKFMQEKKVNIYSPSIGSEFRVLVHEIRSKKFADQMGRVVDMLNAFIDSKQFVFQKQRIKCFPGTFGQYVTKFIEYLKEETNLKMSSIKIYEYSLSGFCQRMYLEQVDTDTITLENLLGFFSSLQNMREENVKNVKRFLIWLKEHDIIKQDLFLDQIQSSRYRKERLPSYYTKEEVQRIENSVNRHSIRGKRDYAMLLLASRLGLRSADIRDLKFSDIDWDKNEIHIRQIKTQKLVILPLLEDVGVSLIDYIKNARPTTSLKNIFLSFNPPYRVITSATFSSMVAHYVYKSGVVCRNKHRGSHSLRHSLASNLLGSNVSLPTISSILGHSTTESTKKYLAIDLSSLLSCSHDVPTVDECFYVQEGGVFYV